MGQEVHRSRGEFELLTILNQSAGVRYFVWEGWKGLEEGSTKGFFGPAVRGEPGGRMVLFGYHGKSGAKADMFDESIF